MCFFCFLNKIIQNTPKTNVWLKADLIIVTDVILLTHLNQVWSQKLHGTPHSCKISHFTNVFTLFRVGNAWKLKENDNCYMNESFCGAFGAKLGPYGSKNYAGDDYEVRFKPNMCFRGVLKDCYFYLFFCCCLQNHNPSKRNKKHMFGSKRTS